MSDTQGPRLLRRDGTICHAPDDPLSDPIEWSRLLYVLAEGAGRVEQLAHDGYIAGAWVRRRGGWGFEREASA